MDSEYQVGAVADLIARSSRRKHSQDTSDSDDSITPIKTKTQQRKRKLNDSKVKDFSSKNLKQSSRENESSENHACVDAVVPNNKESSTNQAKRQKKTTINKNKTSLSTEITYDKAPPNVHKKNKLLNKNSVESDHSPLEEKRKSKIQELSEEVPETLAKGNKKYLFKKDPKNELENVQVKKKDDVSKSQEMISKKNTKQLKKKLLKLEEQKKKAKVLKNVKSMKDQIEPNENGENVEPFLVVKQGSTETKSSKSDTKNSSEHEAVEDKSESKSKGFPKHVENGSEHHNEEANFNEEQESRTVFVGNLPLQITRKRVTSLFKPYGEVETVRFRSVPVADITMPRKACVKMNNIHEKRTNMNAYVRFKNIESVEKALELNALVIEEHTIRVDTAIKKTSTNSHAIFIGNLPFEAEEEEVRKAFEDCGDIENVRVIRDQHTNIGKGFAYVNFKSSDAVAFALEMENVKIRNREVRIKRSFDKKSGKSSDHFSKGHGNRFSNFSNNNKFGNSKAVNSYSRNQGKFGNQISNGKGRRQGQLSKISDKGRGGLKGGRDGQRFSKDGGRGTRGGASRSNDSPGFRGNEGGFRGKGGLGFKGKGSGGLPPKRTQGRINTNKFQGSTVEEKGNRNNQKKKKLSYDALKKFIIAKKLGSGSEKKKAFNFLSS